ncbi:NmrA domain-containing protein [Mycena venus]|uniref:NmrA domain-containing protein n=1 Tax=Mycena venus TaxID=2733690 RepID=A0A8H6WX72_9AGAR|nr:NmrA domain-containing protein [Mycena venus]
MSAYKSFAVVGGGTVGLPIVNALAEQNVYVLLLSRSGSSTKTVPSSVQVIQVDFNDTTAVAAVFKEHKVDVVLSTVAPTAVAVEWSLVDAAKLAAVKLYLPSKYGFPAEGQTEGFQAVKNQIVAHLKSVNIPSTIVYTGLFVEFIPWLVGYSEDDKKFKLVTKGEAPMSFTAIADIAGFVAYVLTKLPPSELEDRVLRLEGERSSLKDVAIQFKTSVEHVDSAKITGAGSEYKIVLQNLIETGAGSTGWDDVKKVEGSGSNAAGSANALWPGHKWKSIKEVYKL